MHADSVDPPERKKCGHQYACPDIKTGEERCPYTHDLPFPSWTGLYCGTGVSVVALDPNRVPHLLVQREVERDEDGKLHVLKWGSSGGSVLDAPITFPLTRDVEAVRAHITEETFRTAAIREASEESRGVLQLDPRGFMLSDHFEQGNRKKYPNEYLIAKSYLVIMCSAEYRRIQEAIDAKTISGCEESKGSTIDRHVFIPLEQVLSEEMPPCLTSKDRHRWESYKKWMGNGIRQQLETILECYHARIATS